MESRINPPTENFDKPKRKNTWIYVGIIALLLATNIYLFLQKKNERQEKLVVTEQLQQSTSEKEVLQNEYNAALARLDDLTSQNANLKKKLNGKDSDIQHIKDRIKAILANADATKTELKEARSLIKGLNQKIDDYEVQIAALKKQNATLSGERDSVVVKNDSLQKRIDVAKRLHASNIQLIPINLRRGGRKETTTERARKVDLLRVSFDIDENMLAEDGAKELDIRIVNPDGILLSNAALGSGSFIDTKGKTQYYSVSKVVNLSSGVPLKGIDVDWRQAASYDKGAYIVEIYSEGQLIGQGTASLR
ncbi:MAG TPA: hypothetical protein VFL76_03890 [Edaphocola sp.]|nr:hypothetical protein [Edaphocola sp.]